MHSYHGGLDVEVEAFTQTEDRIKNESAALRGTTQRKERKNSILHRQNFFFSFETWATRVATRIGLHLHDHYKISRLIFEFVLNYLLSIV